MLDSFSRSRVFLRLHAGKARRSQKESKDKTKGSRSEGPDGSQIANESRGPMTRTLPAILRVGGIRSSRRPWSYLSIPSVIYAPSTPQQGGAETPQVVPKKTLTLRKYIYKYT